MGLTFDADACYRALVDRLIDTMNQVMDTFYKEAIQGLDFDGRAATEVEKAHVEKTSGSNRDLKLVDAKEFIVTKAKFYAEAIIQSYGTGKFADTTYWEQYESGSLFNPARKGKGTTIVGRPAGSYTNIFGEKETSSGKNEGKPLPRFLYDPVLGYDVDINQPGSHSIQNAEKWVIKDGETRVERYIETAVNDFFANEAKNFFVFV